MSENALNDKVGEDDGLPQHRKHILRQQPQAAHTGVNLDVHCCRAPDLACRSTEGTQSFQIEGCYRDLFEHGLKCLPSRRIAQHQDGGLDSSASKGYRFAETGYTQHSGTIVENRARDAHCTVTVPICFEHDHYICLLTDRTVHLAQIVRDGFQVYLDPGRPLWQSQVHVAIRFFLADEQRRRVLWMHHQGTRDLFHASLACPLDQDDVIGAGGPGQVAYRFVVGEGYKDLGSYHPRRQRS